MINHDTLEGLMREMIEKHIGLDLSAKILWQLRSYEECIELERYAAARELSEELTASKTRTEHARLQLNHYLTVAGIEGFRLVSVSG